MSPSVFEGVVPLDVFFFFFFQLVDSDVYFGAGLFVDFSCILDLCLFSCIVCL